VARIRLVDIRNFRCLKSFAWRPSGGINCLIGPGDVGKSSVLDAIDLCLGVRRSLSFSDADFHGLDVSAPISISVTLGELDDSLKSMEAYGNYLRSFDAATGEIDDEPESGKETVLTLNLSVKNDLEPVWTLVSERSEAQDRLGILPGATATGFAQRASARLPRTIWHGGAARC
jgi:AAA15 family ATPase/GTPase